MLSDITKGTQALARGLRLIWQPGIRRYAIIPLLINLLLFGALLWYGISSFQPLVAWMMSFVPELLSFLEWFIWIFFGMLAAVTIFFSFTPVANIIGAPFNALMSEKIEAQLTGVEIASDVSFWQMAIDSMGSQLRKLIYILIWAAGLFLVSLIPVVNIISPLLWIIFGSWLPSLEYLDYPMGYHDMSFNDQKDLLKSRRGLSLGFGGAVMIMTSIPVVNFLAMPVAVAGATVLWVEQLRKSA